MDSSRDTSQSTKHTHFVSFTHPKRARLQRLRHRAGTRSILKLKAVSRQIHPRHRTLFSITKVSACDARIDIFLRVVQRYASCVLQESKRKNQLSSTFLRVRCKALRFPFMRIYCLDLVSSPAAETNRILLLHDVWTSIDSMCASNHPSNTFEQQRCSRRTYLQRAWSLPQRELQLPEKFLVETITVVAL